MTIEGADSKMSLMNCVTWPSHERWPYSTQIDPGEHVRWACRCVATEMSNEPTMAFARPPLRRSVPASRP